MKYLYLPNWRAYLAEFLGTFVFVFVAAGSVLTANLFADVGVLGVAFATSMALAAMIFATVGTSGGHLNPAVTVAMWLTQRISSAGAVFYILMQVLASFAAAYLLLAVFGNGAMAFFLGGPVLSVDTSVQSAVILEAVLTAALVFAVFATMVDKQSFRSSSNQDDSTAGLKRGPVSFGPLAVGLVVLVASIFAGPVTGAALNPARALGPLLVSGRLDSLLVWVIGPLAGSLFGLVYEFLFLRTAKRK